MIAVITRTSNRPKYFNRCHQSVLSQGNICKHYVITDTLSDIEYIKSNNVHIHHVNKKKLTDSYNVPAPQSAKPALLSIHNLYFNEVYDKITEPWVYHLDDDNYLYAGELVNLLQKVTNDTELVICKIKHFTGLLPRQVDWNNKNIRVGGIDTGCFLVKTELMKKVYWDGWKCGDFRVVDKLNKLSKKTVWVDVTVMGMECQNLGKRNDMK